MECYALGCSWNLCELQQTNVCVNTYPYQLITLIYTYMFRYKHVYIILFFTLLCEETNLPPRSINMLEDLDMHSLLRFLYLSSAMSDSVLSLYTYRFICMLLFGGPTALYTYRQTYLRGLASTSTKCSRILNLAALATCFCSLVWFLCTC